MSISKYFEAELIIRCKLILSPTILLGTLSLPLPNTLNQCIHTVVNKVSVGLSQTKALLLEHLCEAEKVRRAHLKVGIVKKDDLQKQRLFSQTLHEPT